MLSKYHQFHDGQTLFVEFDDSVNISYVVKVVHSNMINIGWSSDDGVLCKVISCSTFDHKEDHSFESLRLYVNLHDPSIKNMHVVERIDEDHFSPSSIPNGWRAV